LGRNPMTERDTQKHVSPREMPDFKGIDWVIETVD
jgi:hypothetical protein